MDAAHTIVPLFREIGTTGTIAWWDVGGKATLRAPKPNKKVSSPILPLPVRPRDGTGMWITPSPRLTRTSYRIFAIAFPTENLKGVEGGGERTCFRILQRRSRGSFRERKGENFFIAPQRQEREGSNEGRLLLRSIRRHLHFVRARR